MDYLFPSGRFNQETAKFELMRYQRWEVELLSTLQDTLVRAAHTAPSDASLPHRTTPPHSAKAISTTSPFARRRASSGIGAAATSTEEQLAHELRALQSSLELTHNELAPNEPAPHEPLCSSDKKYSPGTRGKIAALLRRSIQEVRRSSASDSIDCGDSPSRPVPSSPLGTTKIPANSALKLLKTIHSAMAEVRLDPPTSSSSRKGLSHADIEKHLKLSLRSGDLYEAIGWYQEKVKLISHDFVRSSGNSAATRRTSSKNSTSTFDISSWDDLQLFLDSLKSSLRTASDPPLLSSFEEAQASEQDGISVINALDELALLLMAKSARNESNVVETLQHTFQHQNEILERTEERLEELRGKVRDYSREIAALEEENDVLAASAVRYDRARGQISDLERQLSELEEQQAHREGELRASLANNENLHRSVESLRAENGRLRAVQPQQLRVPPALASRSSRSSANNVLSDSDSEQESKVKASGEKTGGRTSSSVPSHTLKDPRSAVLEHVSALARVSTCDWIALYTGDKITTLEQIQQAQAELAGIHSDLSACAKKFGVASCELTQVILAKKGELLRSAKEKEHAKLVEQNLCCICLEAPKTVLLMPCRHLCVCSVCSEGPPESPHRHVRGANSKQRMIKTCPVCRAAVTECLNVFS